MVRRLFKEFADAARVAERVKADASSTGDFSVNCRGSPGRRCSRSIAPSSTARM